MRKSLLPVLGVVLGVLAVAGRGAGSQGLTRLPAAAASAETDPGRLAAQIGCPLCHGQRGESPLSNIPSLAGQRPAWLEARLRTFRHLGLTGGDGVMPRYARNLSDQQITALATAYSRDPLPVPPRLVQASEVARGQTLYEQGDPARQVLPCATCHGPTGAGTATPLIPSLTGQHAGYVAYRLGVYRHLPARQGEPEAQAMRTVARSLSDADIRAVAAYAEQLPARSFR
ncbi:c-type cytochrome (plasmid) [Deinococcus sp. KNUC1210]|uniref:c-type cytochrome n=1 Tax=Deinococcus sp. KNUC1210 TaxID=2917691 RepID=UPI001EF0AC23|nr:c-type cytochrome [Deinococcus sp. KNUC1210]ULH13873.1 c-type cytochrome [Deinococcus sp. KNUC1210]